jgi:hypothetical protein
MDATLLATQEWLAAIMQPAILKVKAISVKPYFFGTEMVILRYMMTPW